MVITYKLQQIDILSYTDNKTAKYQTWVPLVKIILTHCFWGHNSVFQVFE